VSEDRLNQKAVDELQSLLSRGYTVEISPSHGLVGNRVRVTWGLQNGHPEVGEGRSHDLSNAMHRASFAVAGYESNARMEKGRKD